MKQSIGKSASVRNLTGSSPPFSDPSCLPLSKKHWRTALVIAYLRKLVNDPIRARHRDRGEQKNILNDLQGSIGELAAIVAAENETLIESTQHDLLSFSGPVDDVDLIACTVDRDFRIEAKCLLMQGNKRLFLVNQVAHERSLARHATGYLPVITSTAAPVAFIGRLIPAEELDSWQTFDIKYGDTAIGMPLQEF